MSDLRWFTPPREAEMRAEGTQIATEVSCPQTSDEWMTGPPRGYDATT
jgi:hypothetical protein